MKISKTATPRSVGYSSKSDKSKSDGVGKKQGRSAGAADDADDADSTGREDRSLGSNSGQGKATSGHPKSDHAAQQQQTTASDLFGKDKTALDGRKHSAQSKKDHNKPESEDKPAEKGSHDKKLKPEHKHDAGNKQPDEAARQHAVDPLTKYQSARDPEAVEQQSSVAEEKPAKLVREHKQLDAAGHTHDNKTGGAHNASNRDKIPPGHQKRMGETPGTHGLPQFQSTANDNSPATQPAPHPYSPTSWTSFASSSWVRIPYPLSSFIPPATVHSPPSDKGAGSDNSGKHEGSESKKTNAHQVLAGGGWYGGFGLSQLRESNVDILNEAADAIWKNARGKLDTDADMDDH